MTVDRPLSSTEAKIRRGIVSALEAAPRPLTFRQLRAAYDGPDASEDLLRSLLNRAVIAGAVFACSGDRFWNRDEKQLHLETARALIQEKPRTKSELVRALGELDTGCTEAWREQIFEELRESPGIHVLPVLGNQRSHRLSFKPPRLEDYIDRARAEYKKAQAALIEAGYAESDILRAICGVQTQAQAGPDPESRRQLLPARADDDLDFQRDAAELLVFAWQDSASPEARSILEDTLFSLGLDPVGKPGDVTSFDGRLQHCRGQLNPGQNVRITQQGWQLRNARGQHLVAKASVEPVP